MLACLKEHNTLVDMSDLTGGEAETGREESEYPVKYEACLLHKVHVRSKNVLHVHLAPREHTCDR